MADADATAASGTGLAERLGFAPDARVAVVHVDDIGMCHAANEGGFEALRNGPATCGSLMVPCPWFAEAAEWARAEPELDLGVHLTLTSEWSNYRWGPVCGRDAVPSLCAPDGRLWPTAAQVEAHARPEEAERELRAQIETALEAGIDVTHIDSHMGTAFLRPFISTYARLAREFELPLFAVLPRNIPRDAKNLPEGLQAVLDETLALLDEGVPVLDGYDADSLSFAPGAGLEHNQKRIAALGPGVHYLICHAARGGDELEAIAPEAHCRDFERGFYGGPQGRDALAAAGVETVGMRALRELMRAR